MPFTFTFNGTLLVNIPEYLTQKREGKYHYGFDMNTFLNIYLVHFGARDSCYMQGIGDDYDMWIKFAKSLGLEAFYDESDDGLPVYNPNKWTKNEVEYLFSPDDNGDGIGSFLGYYNPYKKMDKRLTQKMVLNELSNMIYKLEYTKNGQKMTTLIHYETTDDLNPPPQLYLDKVRDKFKHALDQILEYDDFRVEITKTKLKNIKSSFE